MVERDHMHTFWQATTDDIKTRLADQAGDKADSVQEIAPGAKVGSGWIILYKRFLHRLIEVKYSLSCYIIYA